MLNGFIVEYNGQLFSKSGCSAGNAEVYKSENGEIEVKNIIKTFPGLNIVEKWIVIRNISSKKVRITRADSVYGMLPKVSYNLKYFTSYWAGEFNPVDIKLEGTKILEATSGRSSHGTHPWFSLIGEEGSILTGAIAWSGNWIVRFEPVNGSEYMVSGGLSNWNFHKDLEPDGTMEGIHFIYLYLTKGELSDTAVEFGRWGRKYCYPRNAFSESMPLEWNSWSPYGDHSISEEIVKQNAEEAVKLNFDICTQDAGWFGPHSDSSQWTKVRGDWNKVNFTRFPSGMRGLSDIIHGNELKFGLWCEIEGLGDQADLNKSRPELIAMRDNKHLGYVCMGNPQSREWALNVLETLIRDYKADWIKLDFNLDPGAGCNRTDHGHGAGDGLYEHYMGYYKLLDTIREKYPEVMIENCSSGGLRIDLGLAGRTHRTFLSDADYTENHMQVFWGAVNMLHPSVCLHFSWSPSSDDFNVIREPISEDMPVHVFDYYIRAVLMGSPGFSYRLPQLPGWCKERLRQHVDFYKSISEKFIRDSDLYLLTGQCIRNGKGDRWNAFEYLTESRQEALLYVFRLAKGEMERAIRLKGLETEAVYNISYKDSGCNMEKSGRELMEEGLKFDSIKEQGSEIVVITKSS